MSLISWLMKIPIDKQQHFYLGAILGFTLTLFTGYWIAFVIVMIAGALKELWDYFHPPHCCEFLDWLATSLGGLYVVIMYLIQLGIIKLLLK